MGWLDSNGLRRVWANIRAALAEKQDKLVGAAGQVVGFDAAGNPEAQSTASLVGPQGPKGDPGLLYGTCATASSTAAKVVALTGFTLTTGAVVAVKFTNANSAASPTLNVNSTGAKSIVKYGSTTSITYMWQAGELVEFVYDGAYWVMVRGGLATTTYYGLTKLSSSVTSTSTALAATPSAVKSAYDLANAALPKSGGTMTGALSVPAPTADAHAATKAYVDKLLYNFALAMNLHYVTLSGAHDALVTIEHNENTGPDSYWFSYDGVFDTNASGTLYLNPPPGFAFNGLAGSSLPILKCNNQEVIGTIDTLGRYRFPLSSGMAGKTFRFLNEDRYSAFVFLSMEAA